MNLYSIALDDLHAAINDAGGLDAMTIDQRLQAAQVQALLSISQELSLIQAQGIRPEWSARTD